MFSPASFSAGAFSPNAFAGLSGGAQSLPTAKVPFIYALVPLGPLSIQTFPGALEALVNPRVYTAPFLRPENGNDVPGPADFRMFTVVLPQVTRTDF